MEIVIPVATMSEITQNLVELWWLWQGCDALLCLGHWEHCLLVSQMAHVTIILRQCTGWYKDYRLWRPGHLLAQLSPVCP